MPNPFAAVFCCFTAPKDPKSSTASSKPGADGHPPSSQDKASSRRVPERNELPASGARKSGVPLDYVTGKKETPEEFALKGRHPSSSNISLQPRPTSRLANERRLSSADGHRTDGQTEVVESATGVASGTAAATVAAVEEESGFNQGHNMAGPESHTGIEPGQQEPIAEIGEVELPQEDIVNPNGDLLPPQPSEYEGRKCLVLDLDETLVHSSFKYIWNADFVIPVEIEGIVHDVYVIKRPGVDEFLERISKLYEVVVFTASVAKYGDPLLDKLDPLHRVHYRLFRESCYNFHGNYIKNLAWLGRPLESVIIIDNSPAAYILQPRNAVPVSSWFADVHDNELLDMMPFLEDLSGQKAPNVLNVLGHEW